MMEQKGYRLLVDVYKVPVGFGTSSSEETENALNRDRDYFCQFQADTVSQLLNDIGKYRAEEPTEKLTSGKHVSSFLDNSLHNAPAQRGFVGADCCDNPGGKS